MRKIAGWICLIVYCMTNDAMSQEYFGATFVLADSQSIRQFCQRNAPPECFIGTPPSYEYRQADDSLKRIFVSFYDLHPDKGRQTAMIGVLFIEDSTNSFHTVCIDTFRIIPVQKGLMFTCERIQFNGSGRTKGTEEYFVQISYGGCCSNCPNGGAVMKTYYYEWPRKFEGINQLEILRVIE